MARIHRRSVLSTVRNILKSEKFVRSLTEAATKSPRRSRLKQTLKNIDAHNRDRLAENRYEDQRKKGLNINQLIASTQPVQRRNAIRDEVTVVNLKLNKNRDKIRSRTLTYDRTSSHGVVVRPHKHTVEIIPSSSEAYNVSFTKAKRLKVGCDCDWFKFHCEYALNKKYGAADIVFSNGEFPVDTNPRLQAQICKHLFVLLKYIRQRKL